MEVWCSTSLKNATLNYFHLPTRTKTLLYRSTTFATAPPPLRSRIFTTVPPRYCVFTIANEIKISNRSLHHFRFRNQNLPLHPIAGGRPLPITICYPNSVVELFLSETLAHYHKLHQCWSIWNPSQLALLSTMNFNGCRRRIARLVKWPTACSAPCPAPWLFRWLWKWRAHWDDYGGYDFTQGMMWPFAGKEKKIMGSSRFSLPMVNNMLVTFHVYFGK